MIHTQYGNEIKIIGYDPKTQLVRAIRQYDGYTRIYPAWSLRASEGIVEINKACIEAKEERLDMTMDV